MAAKTNLTGTKFLIAAGALAGTIGGWIVLSLTGAGSSTGSGTIQDTGIVDLLNRPLPTLAEPNTQNILPGSVSIPSVGVQPTAVPTLRKVNIQPAAGASGPVVSTRSSR